MDILFLEPVFKERIWGSNRLEQFGYHLPYKKTGECWAISAHPNGESIVKFGRYKGLKLSELYQNHRELFNHIQADRFPLLVKILDANDDLSVQVHPNDHYAKIHANDLGKTECWVVLEADNDAMIIFGHRAKTKNEFIEMIEKGQWDDLLIKKNVKKGDFFYVPSTTVHALGKGLLILETQQSSDTTYRLYDYDRKDDQGNTRELHINESVEVTMIPHENPKVDMTFKHIGSSCITTYISNEYFTVEKWHIQDRLMIKNNYYKLVSVTDGVGKINGLDIKKGDHFIVCANVESLLIEGTCEFIVSWV